MDETAVRYLSAILYHDDDEMICCYSLEKLMSEINHAPPNVKKIFKPYCRTEDAFEEYLIKEKYFWGENRQVTLYYPWIEKARDEAVCYFENTLDDYTNRPCCKNLQGHIGQADKLVKSFFQQFYSGDFKQFFLNYPDKFVVYNDDTVSLTENEAVNYFQEKVEEDRSGWFYMYLRGCLGQAPRYIINFINKCYPREDFLQFLKKNSHVFDVDEEGCVFLNEEDEDESDL